MRRRVVVLEDLSFKSKYFHSVNLRVQYPPGSPEPCLCLVIVLFIQNGMKEYGVTNLDPHRTIHQYNDLLRQLGRGSLTETQVSVLLKDKQSELEFVKNARAQRSQKQNEGVEPVEGMPGLRRFPTAGGPAKP